ncbi:hypothetical protein Bbelb_012770 [Branchiostoma belcheri]|nr:hypothetical protein Bbelb_012770 [Branchiostoma belcheri]
MDLPKPPEDPELRNIIDKLANFVARNGPEFEKMTKQKQKDNPKFKFLFGGEFYNYYQYKVTTEQQILNQQKQKLAQQQAIIQEAVTQQAIQSAPWQSAQPPQIPPQGPPQIPPHVQDQINQSNSNLMKQHQVLMAQQQEQIDTAIQQAREVSTQNLAKQVELDLSEFDKVVQPIIEQCTKDAISAGKGWIFNASKSADHCKCISQYLLCRILGKSSSFELKLHLIYLINDVLHHCVRKQAEDLKQSLQSVVVPIFSSAQIGAEEEKQQKLTKLLALWEKNNYFETSIIEQLKNPTTALAQFHTNEMQHHAAVVQQVQTIIQQQFQQLQNQHEEFVRHLTQQATMPPPGPGPAPGTTTAGATSGFPTPHQVSQVQVSAPYTETSQGQMPPHSGTFPTSEGQMMPNPPTYQNVPHMGQPYHPPPQQFDYQHGQQYPPNFPPPRAPHIQDYNHGHPLPPLQTSVNPLQGGPGGPAAPPNIPPPNLPVMRPDDAHLMPSVPYYELPAGLMAPLVKLEDTEYRPLDPEDIRLPPPMPPSDRLLAAVEAFYSPPSHDRPRNRHLVQVIDTIRLEKKRKKLSKNNMFSFGLGTQWTVRVLQGQEKVFTNEDEGKDAAKEVKTLFTFAQLLQVKVTLKVTKSSQKEGRVPLPSPLSAYLPLKITVTFKKSFSSQLVRLSMPFYESATMDTKISSANKGHQLLTKMGWSGAGLGATEQGIQEPIRGGDVRDRSDMFKGVGVTVNDPFENFRKSKSQSFVERMKARGEGGG